MKRLQQIDINIRQSLLTRAWLGLVLCGMVFIAFFLLEAAMTKKEHAEIAGVQEAFFICSKSCYSLKYNYGQIVNLYQTGLITNENKYTIIAGEKVQEVVNDFDQILYFIDFDQALYTKTENLKNDVIAYLKELNDACSKHTGNRKIKLSEEQTAKYSEKNDELTLKIENLCAEYSSRFEQNLKLTDNLTIINQIIRVIILVFLLLGSFLYFYYVITRKIRDPVYDLIKMAHAISLGNYNEHLKVTGKDELSYLADTFNKMVDSLKATISNYDEEFVRRKNVEHDLKELNDNLELIVEKRTKELIATCDNLRSTQNMLIESEKMASLGNLVAGIAHEINTPIGISYTTATHLKQETELFLELFESGQVKKSQFESYINSINEAISILTQNLIRASELVKSFKSVAVEQSAEQILKINMKKCINDALTSLRINIKNTKYQVSLECPEDLYLTTDPGAIVQVISNFFNNSLMHGFEDMDEGKITITVRETMQGCEINYRDNGKGMNDETCKKIYDPFYTTKLGEGGSGLGMHIVYNLITQRLMGSIFCKSKPNEGVLFEIFIPDLEDKEIEEKPKQFWPE